jgi:ABC-2 type transport system ATP-binding protein
MSTVSASPAWAIDLTHVAKTYKGKVQALRGIEMRVRAGEVFGLLGPNGAGKSTLVKILMTVIAPTRADGAVLGKPVGDKDTLRRIGYLPEHHRFPDYLTGRQVLDFYGGLAGVPRRERAARIDPLLELVGMKDWGNQRVRGYSKGMRQRIGIAQALVNNPDLILLDEPTDGVDPVGRRDIRQVCQRLKDEGKTVFLNSHLLSELELVCDRVAILVQGLVASQGTLDELTRDRRYYEIEAALEPAEARAIWSSLLPADLTLAPKPGAGDVLRAESAGASHAHLGFVELERSTLRLGTTEAGHVQPFVDALRARGVMLRALRPVRPTLEDLFMAAVTDPTTGKALPPGAAKDPANARQAGAGQAGVQEAAR